jgi:hypothetical protein
MKKAFLAVALVAGIVFGQLRVAQAQGVNDFVINSFDADYTLTRNDPQGELRVVETIDVDFSAFNHGIERAIPKKYKDNSLGLHVNNIHSDTNAPAQYTTYSSNGNTVLRIGDPSRTVTGHQSYTID